MTLSPDDLRLAAIGIAILAFLSLAFMLAWAGEVTARREAEKDRDHWRDLSDREYRKRMDVLDAVNARAASRARYTSPPHLVSRDRTFAGPI